MRRRVSRIAALDEKHFRHIAGPPPLVFSETLRYVGYVKLASANAPAPFAGVMHV